MILSFTISDLMFRRNWLSLTIHTEPAYTLTKEKYVLYTNKERKWQPTPVFSPGKSHAQRNLAAYSPRGCKSRTQLSD